MSPQPATATPALGPLADWVVRLAATTDPTRPTTVNLTVAAVLAGLLTAAVYALGCWWFPFAHCRGCGGTGKKYRDDGKVYRYHRWCAGTGRRLRIGRRIFNHYARLRAQSPDTRKTARAKART